MGPNAICLLYLGEGDGTQRDPRGRLHRATERYGHQRGTVLCKPGERAQREPSLGHLDLGQLTSRTTEQTQCCCLKVTSLQHLVRAAQAD